jgi:hypothetical protein
MNTTTINPFDRIASEYDQWFDDNKFTFLSELEVVKYFTPSTDKGIEIGVGTGSFVGINAIK